MNAKNEETREVKVIYVDNCCAVGKQLKESFPSADIKLDAFPWLRDGTKQWRIIIQSKQGFPRANE